MKKSMILLGMLSIGYAYAQEGNVGINTENPKATLEILPNSANLTKTTNEGIIAPKLTKARIADIADANLVEGTLVYATDTVYTAENATTPTAKDKRVAKITEKGYYFYNGTEWVKTESEWIYNSNTKNIELKRSGSNVFIPKTYYTEQGGYIRMGIDKLKLWNYGTKNEVEITPDNLNSYNMSYINSKNIAPSATSRYRSLHNSNLVLSNEGTVNTYLTHRNGSIIVESDNTKNHGDLTGVSEVINLHGTGTVLNATTMQGAIRIGRASVTREATGVLGFAIVNTDKNVYGINASKSDISFEENSAKITEANGNMIRLNFEDRSSSTITNLSGNLVRFVTPMKGSNTIENFYAFKHEGAVINSTSTLKNNYGLYIGNVSGASTTNRAIHTEEGKIRFGDLADSSVADGVNRQVVVDKDGVLKVGTATASTPAPAVAIGSTASMECNAENRGKMNFIQGADGKSDVFGICMKNKDGNYYWGYMVGGNNPTNGTGAFGNGL